MTASPVESLTREPYTPITIEAAGIIKLSSDSQGVCSVQSTLPTQLSNDSVNAPKEQLDSGLIRQKYRDLGYGFESQSGDVLSVLYTGRLVDGTVFDTNTTAGRSEFSFVLGSGQVIQGFDLGLIGASLGDIYHLEIPASLGYGSRATGSIPANSTLLFDVEIRGISRGSAQLTYQNAIGNTVDTFTLKKDGIPVHTEMLGSEWMIIAAERINEANQILWKNILTNKLLVWAFDSSWNWTSSSALIEPSSGKGKEVESQFGVDTNSDGSIFVYKTGTTSTSVDVMTGSSADEFFAPLGVGTTGADRIIVGGGKNQIQLQASSGTNLYANSKQSDFLVVEDFNALTDQLLLEPTQAYGYYLANFGQESGLAIYEDNNKDGQYNVNDDEVIVWLKGVTAMPAISFGAATFAVSGTAQVGQVLTVAKTADDPDGNGTFAYQWQSSTDGTTWGNIGTNAATYTIAAAEQSKQVRVRVFYTDAQNFRESLTVAAGTVAVLNNGNGTPGDISGSSAFQEGVTLTAPVVTGDPDGDATNPNYAYQWYKGSTAIPNATASTYAVPASGAGTYKVAVTYTDAQGFTATLDSPEQIITASNIPAYTISTPSTLSEGAVLTTRVATTKAKSRTTLYYSLSGAGITSDDFSKGALSGSAKVDTKGAFKIFHTIKSDLKTEGDETLNIKLFSDSKRSVQVGSTVSVLISDTSTLPLQVPFNGTKSADTLTGNSANNTISGLGGADILTGAEGADIFKYALKDSLLSGYDKITDFAIGLDKIDGPKVVSVLNLKELGAVASLDQSGIAAVLSSASFTANGAATFSFSSGSIARTFLALNDTKSGFSSATDAIIEITGYSGSLTGLAII